MSGVPASRAVVFTCPKQGTAIGGNRRTARWAPTRRRVPTPLTDETGELRVSPATRRRSGQAGYREHGLDADLGGARAAHDAGARILLRGHGPLEERAQHADDELHLHRRSRPRLGDLRLLTRRLSPISPPRCWLRKGTQKRKL